MWNEKLLENLAEWMIAHGEVIFDVQRSNYYNGVRTVGVRWRGGMYVIIQVDGMTCEIQKY